MNVKGTKVGKTKFGRLVTHRKYKGPCGPIQSRKILNGKNKGKRALWF